MPLSLLGQRHPLASAVEQRHRLATIPLPDSFSAVVQKSLQAPLKATNVAVFQMNLGKKCNQTCAHCHVDAGPDRKEVMPDDVMDACLRVIETSSIPLVDITGGAPELHPRFEELVRRSTAAGKRVLDRCNLTILMVARHQHLPQFFKEQRVELVCSLPYHDVTGTDAQRGSGTFDKSVEALKLLNGLGYGMPGSPLVLTLVANPVGAFLPAPQRALEDDFRRVLMRKHGISFTNLLALTNMPISRYLEWLDRSGNTQDYMSRLAGAFNPQAAQGVMCRDTISVGWDGALYDCDFNQMLEMPVMAPAPQSIFTWEQERLDGREIAVANHCFGCTAGQGSSCGGATV